MGKKSIVKCAVNQRQVVIALTGGELVYFEMDPVSIFSTCSVSAQYFLFDLNLLIYVVHNCAI